MKKQVPYQHVFPLGGTLLSLYAWVAFFSSGILDFFGLLLSIAGLIIWWAGNLTIGPNWDHGHGKPKIKKLVTHGIYSKLRHPIYIGIITMSLGLAIMYTEFWFVIIVSLVIGFYVHRIHAENTGLSKILGKKYDDYRKSTWF